MAVFLVLLTLFLVGVGGEGMYIAFRLDGFFMVALYLYNTGWRKKRMQRGRRG
ncbi:MAG: hypothetical protein WEB04_09580 [Dehalococcoidia bacterium]